MPRKGPERPDMSLTRLYFGKDDAESDFAKGGLLKQGFLRTRAYEEALAGTKTLIIGRKGSGKSAICLMLRNTLSIQERCALVTPDEISADEIRRFHLPGIPPEQSKQLIWRYLFVVQIAKFILARSKKTPISTDDLVVKLEAIKKFLIDNGEVEDVGFVDRFWKIIERLKGAIAIEAFSVKLKIDTELKAPSPGTRAHSNLDVVEAHLGAAAKLLNYGNEIDSRFHLLVDQIEKVWSNDRESDSMVVGLLLASKAIQKSFEFVDCTVFLRTDIYEQLQFQDRDKLRGDEFHIDWDENSLLELILARASASLGTTPKPKEFWSGMFPQTVDAQPCARFLIGRTLMRPRDIIQLCNACRDTARNNRHNNIEESDIRNALAIYSAWKLNDLQNEWSVNYPFLPDAFLLLSNSSYMISRASVDGALTQVKADLVARYPSLAHALSTDTFLNILYSVGLIGALRGGKASYSFEQKNDGQIRPADKDFIIHPSFRNALQSTSAIKLSPYEARERLAGVIVGGSNIIGTQNIRGSISSRAFGYAGTALKKILEALARSDLPEDIRREVTTNVLAMLDELNQIDEYELPLARDALVRLTSHLQQIGRRLGEGGWLSGDRELLYTLDETVEELMSVAYRGDLREYRRSS